RLRRLGRIIGEADRIRLLSPVMHRDLVHELRWTPNEVSTTRDGIDVATLELTPADLAALKMLISWPTMAQLKRIQGGKALRRPAEKSFSQCSAAALIAIPHQGASTYLMGGRALQRTWLTATLYGLAVQPQGVLLYLLARLRRGKSENLAQDDRDLLSQIRDEFRELFEV